MFKYILVIVAAVGLFSCKKDKEQIPSIPKAFAIYIKNPGDSVDLWYSQQDGSSMTRVVSGVGGEVTNSPAWSSDGRTIYFIRNTSRMNENGIYSIKPNGNDLKTIYKDNDTQSRKFFQLVASGDNQLVIFSYQIPRNGRKVIELYKMCPCGTQLVRLTNFETAAGGSPVGTEAYAGSFSSDSKYLYFSQQYPAAAGNSPIFIYRLEISTGETVLLNTLSAGTVLGAAPSISPDGTKLLLNIGTAIYIMNSDGRNLTALSVIKGYRPQWGANSQDIYFSSMDIPSVAAGIYRTDITAAQPVLVSKNSSLGIYGGYSLNN